ncbi:MAG: DUF4340 domain-containing protein [Candidatus Eisenbacteria bacterium]|nr:DUF4340 domain-containing protein [Candidatus Eisenbacteria bacterium]
MRGRTLLILLAILVVFGGIVLLFDTNRKSATEPSERPLFPALKVDQVDQITIRSAGKETTLEKRGTKWHVATEGGFEADQKAVQDIVDRLPRLFADRVVSTNPANRPLFSVDSTGTEIRIGQKGKEVAHFFVGKPGEDFHSTYVRAADSDKVVQVPEYLPSLFQRGDTWRDRVIFSFEEANVAKYEYKSPSRGRLSASRDESGAWKIDDPEPAPIQPGKMDPTIRQLSRLRAAAFADDVMPAEAGIEIDSTRVTVTLADGSVHSLVIGGQTTSSQVFVKRDGADQIYRLARGTLTQLLPARASLVGEGL